MRVMLAALACAIATSACATVELHPTPAQVAAFPGSGMAMIAIGLNAESTGCPYGDVVLQREGGAETTAIFTTPYSSNVAIVAPGKYTPVRAVCRTSQMQITLPGMDMWFLPVDVKAGEVVHLGNLTAELVTVETDKSDAQELGDAVLTLGLSLFNGPNNTHKFPMYDVKGAVEGDRESIREYIGGLADKMYSRKLVRVLSPSAVAAAFRAAYAPHADGTAVTEEEAKTKFSGEIRKAIAISIAEFVKARTPTGAPKADAQAPAPPAPVTPQS